MATSASTSKKSSTFESVFNATVVSDLEIVSVKVKFIKIFTYNEQKRAMLLIEHDGDNKKVYCFPDTVIGLKAPFKAELLVEKCVHKEEEYWNVTAVTDIN